MDLDEIYNALQICRKMWERDGLDKVYVPTATCGHVTRNGCRYGSDQQCGHNCSFVCWCSMEAKKVDNAVLISVATLGDQRRSNMLQCIHMTCNEYVGMYTRDVQQIRCDVYTWRATNTLRCVHVTCNEYVAMCTLGIQRLRCIHVAVNEYLVMCTLGIQQLRCIHVVVNEYLVMCTLGIQRIRCDVHTWQSTNTLWCVHLVYNVCDVYTWLTTNILRCLEVAYKECITMITRDIQRVRCDLYT